MTGNEDALRAALEKLNAFLGEFPEHDQADLRVWEASQLLQKAPARSRPAPASAEVEEP